MDLGVKVCRFDDIVFKFENPAKFCSYRSLEICERIVWLYSKPFLIRMKLHCPCVFSTQVKNIGEFNKTRDYYFVSLFINLKINTFYEFLFKHYSNILVFDSYI
eukprot:NODE_19_length_47148_cov_1.447810.p44 type:complete len:104 gc:universal NODE_19_length_47148_cov_1.447810:8226-7915(-)